MGRISIDYIAPPPPEYGIIRERTSALRGFETMTLTRAEDRTRIRLAGRCSVQHALGLARVHRLIGHIEQSARRCRRSLASATYMRDLRQRVGGQLWWLAARTHNLDPRVITLFPRGWEVSAGQLHRFNPRPRLAAVRSLINRCGGHMAGGYLIAFIHGDFEPGRQVYQLHLHILAAGGLRDVLDQVARGTPTAKSNRKAYGLTEFVRQRLRMEGPLTNLPRPLTYLVKSYWPSRVQYRNEEGKLRRQQRARRIPEPYHTELLLWLDRWQLRDLTLMMNLSVGRDGFVLSDRSYTNGEIE